MTDYSNYTDHELTALLNQGNEAAFKLLYDRYWTKLFVVAANRLNDTGEAEEVVQDIFLNLWRKREGFKLKTGFDNYLAVAVKFEVINRRAVRAKYDAFTAEAITKEPIAADFSFQKFDLEHLQKELQHAINALPPKCRMVFKMSKEQELSNKKIAEELGISEKAVEKHMTHALKTLKTKFGPYLILLLML